MLFDVAAALVTSVALSGLTGAAVAPEIPRTSHVIVAGIDASTPRTTDLSDLLTLGRQTPDAGSVDTTPHFETVTLGPSGGPASQRAVDSSLLPTLGGRLLLEQLALLSPREVESFTTANPGTIARLLANPPSAQTVAGWWALTPAAARTSLLDGAPSLIGNLDGLPMHLRDAANRAELRAAISEAEAELPSLGRAERVDAEQRLHMLAEVREAIVAGPGHPDRSLLSLDTVWPGRAAVVVGDLESADYVSYLVPGMFFTTDRLIVDWALIAQDLHEEQTEWVTRLGRDDADLAGASTATVAWIGYQTPGLLDIASLELAEQGSQYISSAVAGIQATREGDLPYVTLVTHSYGSTATLMALADGAVEADALVLIGSPGSAAQSVDDIRMRPDRVFVGEAAWDPVVNSAFFGSDPGADSFGATTMSVAGGTDPITGKHLGAAVGHLGYFDVGSESVRNTALVGLDRGDLVTGASRTAPRTLLAGGR